MFEEEAHGGTPEWVPAKKAANVDSIREKPYPWGIVNPVFVYPRPIPMMYQKAVTFTESGDGFWIADELTNGFPMITFKGHGKAKIMYAESFGSGGEKKDRLDRSLSFNGVFDLVDVDGEFTFEPFWFRCARIIRIETEGDVEVTDFAFDEVGYPMLYTASPCLAAKNTINLISILTIW